jgi:hypothetical protein
MRKLKNKEKMIKIGAVLGTVGVVGGILSTLRMKRKIRELDEEIGNMDERKPREAGATRRGGADRG